MSNPISMQAGYQVHRPKAGRTSGANSGAEGGPSDSFVYSGLSGIEDTRLLSLISSRSKRDASGLGEGWSSSFYNAPVFGNRGINSMREVSTFKSPQRADGNRQVVTVDWERRGFKLTTVGQDQEAIGGASQARFDYQGRVIPSSIQTVNQ